MNNLKKCFHLWILLALSFVFVISIGCDSGKKTIDQVTGNEDIKQYHKSKGDIDNVVDKQTERLNSINKDASDDELDDETSEETDEE